MPMLARIPRRGRSDRSATAFREANRILRTNLQFASVGRQVQTIAITSAREGEGKTTTVANLALATAEVGPPRDRRRGRPAPSRAPARAHARGARSRCDRASPTTWSRRPRIEDSIHPTGRPGIEHHPGRAAAPEPIGAARVAPRAHGGGASFRRARRPGGVRLPAAERRRRRLDHRRPGRRRDPGGRPAQLDRRTPCGGPSSSSKPSSAPLLGHRHQPRSQRRARARTTTTPRRPARASGTARAASAPRRSPPPAPKPQ